MDFISAALSACLILSLGFNAFQAYLAKINRKKKAPDLTAQDLLRDLMAGGAVLRIEVIDQSQLFLRSPR